MYFTIPLHGRRLSLGLSLGQSSGLAPHATAAPTCDAGGGEGRTSPFDANAPCGTTAVVFGDLLVFKTSCITAEPKEELLEMLHMLKQYKFFRDGI